MSALRLVPVVLLAVVCLGAAPEPAGAVNFPSASCNGGGCGGWFRSAVSVSWSFDPGGTPGAGCGGATVSEDTGGTGLSCTVTYPGGSVTGFVSVQKDSSPPSIEGSLSRSPDADGWYTKPVSVSFSGDDGASGLASCSGDGTYGGPDGGAVALSGTCRDNAGNSASKSFTIKYDATAPSVTAATDRKPDANGWYNHPVAITFAGTDGGSGVKECSPKVTYGGPDASPAKLVGQCRDAAGNLSAPLTVDLKYDGTPPAKPTVKWSRKSSSISLSWSSAADVARTTVMRTPGLKTKRPGLVYQVKGRGRRLVDKRIVPGGRYSYEVSVFDQAGNRAFRTIGLRPAAGIVAPSEGAVVRRPPLIAWSAVEGATFYNVQLWRGKTKVLTTWVRGPKLALKQRWTFGGKPRALANGKYTAYVWPALGTRAAPRYGKLVGQVGFVVRRR